MKDMYFFLTIIFQMKIYFQINWEFKSEQLKLFLLSSAVEKIFNCSLNHQTLLLDFMSSFKLNILNMNSYFPTCCYKSCWDLTKIYKRSLWCSGFSFYWYGFYYFCFEWVFSSYQLFMHVQTCRYQGVPASN